MGSEDSCGREAGRLPGCPADASHFQVRRQYVGKALFYKVAKLGAARGNQGELRPGIHQGPLRSAAFGKQDGNIEGLAYSIGGTGASLHRSKLKRVSFGR